MRLRSITTWTRPEKRGAFFTDYKKVLDRGPAQLLARGRYVGELREDRRRHKPSV